MFGHYNECTRCEGVESKQLLYDRTQLTVVKVEKKFRVP
jgi:hypothetical protein